MDVVIGVAIILEKSTGIFWRCRSGEVPASSASSIPVVAATLTRHDRVVAVRCASFGSVACCRPRGAYMPYRHWTPPDNADRLRPHLLPAQRRWRAPTAAIRPWSRRAIQKLLLLPIALPIVVQGFFCSSRGFCSAAQHVRPKASTAPWSSSVSEGPHGWVRLYRYNPKLNIRPNEKPKANCCHTTPFISAALFPPTVTPKKSSGGGRTSEPDDL